jgi:hypothetical protein
MGGRVPSRNPRIFDRDVTEKGPKKDIYSNDRITGGATANIVFTAAILKRTPLVLREANIKTGRLGE